MIEAAAEYGVKVLGASPETAERAFERHFQKVLRHQTNKDAVLIEARNILENDQMEADHPGELSEEFLDRLESHAGLASTEALRSMFGHILASEVRLPGSISKGTMNFVSMLDRETAELINTVAPYCIGDMCYMVCLPDQIKHYHQVRLEQAGFWSPGSTMKFSFSEENGRKRLMHAGTGEIAVYTSKEDMSLSLDIAILSIAGKELVTSLGVKPDWDRFAGKIANHRGLRMGIHVRANPQSDYKIKVAYIKDNNDEQLLRVELDADGKVIRGSEKPLRL
nr:DUF2806 domain-containing protein [Paracoccus aerius]